MYVKPTNALEGLAQTAEYYIGTDEIVDEFQINQFRKAVTGVASGQAWCMDFVQYCLAQVAMRYGWRQTMFKTELVKAAWNASLGYQRSNTPARGMVAMWVRTGTIFGHCGIVKSVSPDLRSYETVEGNTVPGKAQASQGDGVYEKIHSLPPQSGGLSLLGFVSPFA